jgi:Tol biopolymer transport system component
MNTKLTLLALLALLVLSIAAPSAQSGYDLFQKALAAERANGNLQQAIELYQRVSREFSTDRALAARALLRMADCYAKLGNAQARAIYERVAREYPEQTAAVQEARTHLQAEGPARTAIPGDRLVWGPAREVDLFGTVSPDGRFLTYVDWFGNGNVVVRDLLTGSDRTLTNNTLSGEHGYADFSVISRSGDQIAYSWAPLQSVSAGEELRIVPFDGTAAASQVLLPLNGREGFRPFDWSPDGRWIALLIERADQSSQLAVVNARSGELRVLKSIDWRGVNKAVFSPDGRYLAYDLLEGEGVRTQRVWVMALDASRETAVTPASTTNALMGWAADGRLLFASDRSGHLGLWAMRVEDGRPRDVPVLVKSDLSSTWSLGLARSGALYVWKPAGAEYVAIADFDAAAGEIRPAPAPTFQAFVESRGRPAWSADGKRLLYVSCNTSGGSNCRIFVRDMEKGTTREVRHNLSYVGYPRIGPDGNTIVTQGTDLKGRRAIYLIDGTSGSTRFITAKPDVPYWADWWPDGRSIYYPNQRANEPLVLFRREMGSDVETEIIRTSSCSKGLVRVSPDAHAVACTLRDPGTRTAALMVVPLDGSTARPLIRTREPQGFFPWQWTADSRAILAHKVVPGGTDELWLAPLEGKPRRLNLDIRNWSGEPGDFDLSPDGRRIAFVASAGAHGAEVWALEHFLTPTGGTR